MGYVYGASAPFAPATPLPAASFTRRSFTSLEAFTIAATLLSPAAAPSADANSMSSISTAAVTDSTSSALPFAVRFTTARLPASYDQSAHDSPPCTFTPAVILTCSS